MAHDRTILVENGGHLKFSNDWARRILYQITKDEEKMVSRMASTASMPVDPAILFETKLDFQQKIKQAQEQYNRPDDLVSLHTYILAYILTYVPQIVLWSFKVQKLFLLLARGRNNKSLVHFPKAKVAYFFLCNLSTRVRQAALFQ